MDQEFEVEVESPSLDDFAAYVAAQAVEDSLGSDRERVEYPARPEVSSVVQDGPEQRDSAALACFNSEAHQRYQKFANHQPGTAASMNLDDLKDSANKGLTILEENGSEILTDPEGEL